MDNEWKYKIDLRDNDVFDKLSKLYKTPFPQELKSFIVENNAASPVNKIVDIDNGEIVFSSVLSFNSSETEALSIFDVIDSHKIATAIPFGMDPFGNLFYYSLINGKVIYQKHEEDVFIHTGYSLSEFLAKLH